VTRVRRIAIVTDVCRQMVAAHQPHGTRAEHPHAIEDATIGEHLGKAPIVAHGRDQAATTGEKGSWGVEGTARSLDRHEHAPGSQTVERGEAVLVVRTGPKARILHPQRLE